VQRADADYLLGLLAAADGNAVLAYAHASALDSISATTPASHRLADVVRATAARQRGKCVDALVHLDRSVAPVWFGVAASAATESGGFDRFLRADCLSRLGRHQEAIPWFAALERHVLYDLAMLRPALLGQLRSYRAVGDTRSAAEIERRIAAW
jgi:hypothetical protein